MGVPRVMPRALTLRNPLSSGAEDLVLQAAMVNVGNPHLVLFPDAPIAGLDDPSAFSLHGIPWQQLGALLATDPRFPHGTNVEFVRILSPDHIAFRIFERGCGPTASSGTGTCAAAVAAIALHGCARNLLATAEGGPQQVSWPAAEAELRLTGPATLICRGEAFDPRPASSTRVDESLQDLAL